MKNMKIDALPEGNVLVNIYSEGCTPCNSLKRELNPEVFPKELDLIKLDAVDNFELLTELGVRTVPTTIGFQDGKEVFRIIGNNIQGIKSEVELNFKYN